MAQAIEERLDVVEERVDRLEVMFGHFMTQTGTALRGIEQAVERIERTIADMQAEAAEDRAQMRQIIAEMQAEAAEDRAQMRQIIGEMQAEAAEDRTQIRQIIAEMQTEAAEDRAQMRQIIAEMQTEAAEDRAQMRQIVAEMQAEAAQDRRSWNQRWGQLANKMGTIVEDIIAPSLRRMAREELGCGDERFFAERIVKTRTDDTSQSREFDALYVGENAILLNETKATPRTDYATAFVDFLRSGDFLRYFPEYEGMPVVPVFSSLHLPADLVTYLTRQGVYAVAMGEEAMQVLNLEDVQAQHEA